MSVPAPADRPDPLGWAPAEIERLRLAGLLRQRGATPSGADGPPLVDFGANDYLGLRSDPRLAAAAAAAADRYGWGAGASPVVSGRTEAHAELEHRIAAFEGTEAALVFPSGFATNAGVIPALVDEQDAILTDERNHASIIDGCRLARAERHVYRHAEANDVERLLRQTAPRRRRLIVTDTLFSMEGDFAPLVEIAQLALDHGAMLLVDEAHATGVWGGTGRGAVQHLLADRPDLLPAVTVRVGTLSKALGSAGGFVAGSAQLIDWLYNRARSYVFSTACPPAAAAAATAALGIVTSEPHRRERVRSLAQQLRAALAEEGWDTGAAASQIVPVRAGGPEAAVALSRRLAEAGFYAPAIRPPSVPSGHSLLRLSVSARHSNDEIHRLVAALRSARSPRSV
ncbi:aminotransferase class I/II-fold pyridoxal phosphate-dependent enzyme [Botrimarina hoheduenensis]|uniref:8-amino-7-oxononanoate synthase n=1 Tax=Botrimarina hoheduenensis TaxID=2528000 RepID=A0A5C5W8W1_9BACT|nr:8-amino-7-oxononanoate synthase [Botrimarina hoheduenensis]TWT46703.1 8-amino-7-oxononanoate synthase [Botrimarina hoheduenensis]